MYLSMHETGRAMYMQWPPSDDPLPRQETPEPLIAGELAGPKELRTMRMNLAAATAVLPITPEMAWALPQLLKRIRLFSQSDLSTNGALRALIRTPERDALFLKAFTDSGFLSCDQVIARVGWKYDLDEMKERERRGEAAQVMGHCRVLLAQHGTQQPVDWDSVLVELRLLNSWFPELRTIQLLEQLYTRLDVLRMKSVRVAQRWLDQGAGRAALAPGTVRAGEQERGLRILVVDDNHDLAASLSTLLAFEGHRTSTAHNGLQAVNEASREQYDAILLDLGMPVMDGFEAAALLGQLRPAPALIACSAWDDAATCKRTSDLGFRVHLRKPVPLEVLRAALQQIRPAVPRDSNSA